MMFPPIGSGSDETSLAISSAMDKFVISMPESVDGKVDLESEPYEDVYEEYETELELARQYQKRFNGDVQAALRHVAENE